MAKKLNINVPNNIENINQITDNKNVLPNVCFVLAICLMIFFDFLMFRSFSTWMAPLIIFLLEMFLIEVLAKLLKINEAPVIIRILLRLLKDKGLD